MNTTALNDTIALEKISESVLSRAPVETTYHRKTCRRRDIHDSKEFEDRLDIPQA